MPYMRLGDLVELEFYIKNLFKFGVDVNQFAEGSETCIYQESRVNRVIAEQIVDSRFADLIVCNIRQH